MLYRLPEKASAETAAAQKTQKDLERVRVVRFRNKAAIAFLARDCEKTLPAFLKKVERLRLYFEDSRVFAVENGSQDRTRTILQAYGESHPNVKLDLFDDPDLDRLPRIEKMAVLRNRCLDLVRESGYAPNWYIIIDGDLDFNVTSVVKVMQKAPADWAALFANGRYFLKAGLLRFPVLYYDLFAYLPEPPVIEAGDCMTKAEMLDLRRFTQQALKKTKYLPCRSAFGGVGVYRYDAVKDLRYVVEENSRSPEFDHLCEHIPFNREVSKRGTLYVCRDMKVNYEPIGFRSWLRIFATEHGKEREFQTMKRICRKAFPRRGKSEGRPE